MSVNLFSGCTNSLSSASSSTNYKQYNPQEALQKYMQDNNCDESTAKAALQQMYGAPTQPQGGVSGASNLGISGNNLNASNNGVVAFNQGNNPRADFDNQLIQLGIPQDIVQTHDQEQIKTYADEHSITLPNPPQQGQRVDLVM